MTGSEAMRRSDVGDPAAFDPWPAAQVHVEWGPTGAALAAARGDAVVIVDVLSFSTSVALACHRGAVVLVHSPAEIDELGGRDAAAAAFDAEPIAKARHVDAASGERYSLSPASLATIEPGTRLLLTSLNGATCLAAAAAAPDISVGGVTNRAAVATRLASLSAEGHVRRVTIVAAGERWSSTESGPTHDSLRPCSEDLLGAGAIVDALPGHLTRSPEAAAAAATFRGAADVHETLAATVSGRELITKGFAADVVLAAQIDTIDVVPVVDPEASRGRALLAR